MSETYVPISDLINGGEEIPGPIESEEYSDFDCMPVGNYFSNSREITGKRRPDGHYTYTVVLTGGVTDENGVVYADKYPLKTWISTTPLKGFDRVGKEREGFTSSVAQYLKACAYKVKGLDFKELNNLLLESQTVPVKVYVSRTDRAKKDASGAWVQKNLKAKDFKVGETTNDEGKTIPVYANSVTINGEVFMAKPKVSSFSKIKDSD